MASAAVVPEPSFSFHQLTGDGSGDDADAGDDDDDDETALGLFDGPGGTAAPDTEAVTVWPGLSADGFTGRLGLPLVRLDGTVES
jgi:hypothetical protein